MRKTLIILFAMGLATQSWAAQQAITQIGGVQASVGALKTQTNSRLAAAQSNFTELYDLIDDAPFLAQANAPSIHNILWIDTSGASPIVKYWDGDSWENATACSTGTYTLPVATSSALGGVKQGAGTAIAGDGTISVTAAGIGLGTSDNPSFNSVHASGGNLAAANKQVTKAWQTGLSYTSAVTSVIHGDEHYIAKTTHTADSTTQPGVGASWETAWKKVSGVGGSFDEDGDYTPTGEWDFSGATVTGLSGGSMTWPSSAGVAVYGGSSAWGSSLSIGTAVGNLIQLGDDGDGNPVLPFTIDLAYLTDTTNILSGKANSSCFASESAFNTCFDLTWGGSISYGTGVAAALAVAVDGTGGLASKAALDAISAGSLPVVSDTTPPATEGVNYSKSDYKFRARHANGDVYASAAMTLEAAADTTPATITFADVPNAALSTVYTDCQQVTGINWPAAVSASGGTAAICTSATYATDCGTFGTSPGNISNNGYVCARLTSSGNNSTAVNNAVTVGGGGDTFTATTASGISYTIDHTFDGDCGGWSTNNVSCTASGTDTVVTSTGSSGSIAFETAGLSTSTTYSYQIVIVGHTLSDSVLRIGLINTEWERTIADSTSGQSLTLTGTMRPEYDWVRLLLTGSNGESFTIRSFKMWVP